MSVVGDIASIDKDKQFYKYSQTFDVLERIIRDYEIEHVVRFTQHRSYKIFNTGHEPWKTFKGTLSAPKLLWVSDLVPETGCPYISVSRKIYECQYGKQRKSLVKPEAKADKAPIASYKIGCPCQIEVVEILRLINPKVSTSFKGEVTKHCKRALSLKYRDHFCDLQNNQPTILQFRREFHMTMSPLSSHTHVIGEGAAEHQRIDQIILDRIHELAASGITAVDVITDNLNHYVEEELFKDKQKPAKNNRRFYPRTRDIRNHVYLIKNQKLNKTDSNDTSIGLEELAVEEPSLLDLEYGTSSQNPDQLQQQSYATSLSDGGHYGQTDPLQLSIYQMPHQSANQQMHYQQVNPYGAYTAAGGGPYGQFSEPPHHPPPPPPPEPQQGYSLVSSYSTVTTSARKPKPLNHGTGTGIPSKHPTRYRQRNAKEKFLALVQKLNKIAHAIDSQKDLNKLSAKLVSVIVEAKPMICPDKADIVYHEEPRELLYPRRIRVYKPKKHVNVPKQRYPEINPEAKSLPDKRQLRAEARLKAEETKKKRALILYTIRDKANQEMIERERERFRILTAPRALLPASTATSPVVSSGKIAISRNPTAITMAPGVCSMATIGITNNMTPTRSLLTTSVTNATTSLLQLYPKTSTPASNSKVELKLKTSSVDNEGNSGSGHNQTSIASTIQPVQGQTTLTPVVTQSTPNSSLSTLAQVAVSQKTMKIYPNNDGTRPKVLTIALPTSTPATAAFPCRIILPKGAQPASMKPSAPEESTTPSTTGNITTKNGPVSFVRFQDPASGQITLTIQELTKNL